MDTRSEVSDWHLRITRRQLFGRLAGGIGTVALSSLLGTERLLANAGLTHAATGGLPGLPHFPPKAKRVIFLFQAGAPSQHELFDYKPKLHALDRTKLPESARGPILLGMAEAHPSYLIAAPLFKFQQFGKSGTWVSELLPHTAKIVDDIALLKSVYTEAANHEPGMNYLQTGIQIPGRPSMGAWITYGLGSMNQDLPAFVVLVSQGGEFSSSLYGTAFMPSRYQGIRLRAAADPVYFLSNPAGVSRQMQRSVTDTIAKLDRLEYQTYGDPEIETQITQYETAYRMQTSVPELTDLSHEPDSIFELYGPDARKPGTYAANCLLARRLAERDVRFIQLYHEGWDHHLHLPSRIRTMCRQTDQPSAALIQDLKQRGLLEDTLVIWGGEFGRTVYCEGKLTADDFGRDHHGQCFTMWMAGGGIQPGISFGETDDFSCNVVKDPVHVHDLQATILHCLGIDHTQLTYRFQGRYFRLTDTNGEVVKSILI